MKSLDITVEKTVSLKEISKVFKKSYELVAMLYLKKFGLNQNCIIDHKCNLVNAFLNKKELYSFYKSYPNHFYI